MGCSAEILAVFFDSSWTWHALFAKDLPRLVVAAQ